MATVTKPVALNESLNTTDSTPKNIADVLKDKLGDIASAISGGGGGSGGHTIQNALGANMPQETTMQFKDSHVTDNSQADKTEVEVIKSVASADYSSETEDGLYLIPDGDGSVIEPASEDYVEVTADGVKTYSELLNELYTEIDSTKLSKESYIFLFDSFYVLNSIRNNIYYFCRELNLNTHLYEGTIQVGSSNSRIVEWDITAGGNTQNDISTTKPTSEEKITLYYGNKKAVVDLQTTANRCWYDSNNTVKQKIDAKADTSNIVSGSVELVYQSAYYCSKDVTIPSGARLVANFLYGIGAYNKTSGVMITNLTATSARITAFASGGSYTSGDTVSVNYIAVKS